MRVRLGCFGLAFSLCISVGELAVAAPSNCDVLVGAWEYISPSLPGRVIVSKQANGKYLAVWISTAPDTGSTSAGAGEATCEGSKTTWRILYATDQSSVGKELPQDWQATGDIVQWWFLTAEGKRGDAGAARRLK